MYDCYAQLLADHATDVIRRTSNLEQINTTITRPPEVMPTCELSVRIDFQGHLADQQPVVGYVMCGSLHSSDSRPFLEAMATHLGLPPSLIEIQETPANILSEILNIIVGLAGSDWADEGFEIDFSTPQILSGIPIPPLSLDDQAFCIVITTDSGAKVDILAVFRA